MDLINKTAVCTYHRNIASNHNYLNKGYLNKPEKEESNKIKSFIKENKDIITRNDSKLNIPYSKNVKSKRKIDEINIDNILEDDFSDNNDININNTNIDNKLNKNQGVYEHYIENKKLYFKIITKDNLTKLKPIDECIE